MTIIRYAATLCSLMAASIGYASSEIKIAQSLWQEFSNDERATVLAKYPNLVVIPSESVGVIQSVQAVNRSTPGTNSGAALGGVLGQTMYIDNAFRRSNINYSATAQVGAALLGAAIGSSMDTPPQIRFVINYGVKTLDGQIREVRLVSGDEFTRPVGQCVLLPALTPAEASLCNPDKAQFIRKLSALSQAPEGAIVMHEASGINVKCRVPGVGLMTLEKNACNQMGGVPEK